MFGKFADIYITRNVPRTCVRSISGGVEVNTNLVVCNL